MAETELCLLLHSSLPIQSHLYSLHFSSSDHNPINFQTLTRLRVPNSIPDQFTIAGSCNGLLCLWNSLSEHQYFIYNPFTRNFIQLPNPNLNPKHFLSQHRVASGFGSNSSQKEYKVVRIVYYHRANEVENRLPESEVEILTVGDGALMTWRNIKNTLYQVQGWPSNVVVEEKLHWLTCKYRKNWGRKIICFDLADEEFRQVPSPGVGMFGRNCKDLVSLRGRLSAVVQGFKCLYVWVMKEYGVKESWIKEFTVSIDLQLNNPYADQPINGSQCFPLNLSHVRVLCILQNGEILLQHRCRYLVVFNPNSGVFREIVVPGLVQDFSALVHIGSLFWPDII